MEKILELRNVSKEYKLGMYGGTTLKAELQRKAARKKGLPDPYSQVGELYQEKDVDKFLALDNINFSVNKGERIGIIGHNGAGKSTLLKLISSITSPSLGEIEMNGRVASMLEVGTGFHGELSGRENIYMNGAILGMTKKEIDSKIEDIINFSECRQFIDTPVKRYSSGMYVKLAFSVAAHLDSEIMIMDEVLAVGDMSFQKKCINKMMEISNNENRTILYVSHNMNTIRQLCNRVIVLDKGKKCFDGDVEKGISIYVGEYSHNTLNYDYTLNKRPSYINKKFELLGLDVINSDVSRYRRGDTINLVLHCMINKNVDNIGIRFVFNTRGITIGTSFMDKYVSGKNGDKIDLYLSVPTDNFAPGDYCVSAVPFEINEFGQVKYTDLINEAFYFQIDEKMNDIIWISSAFGYIKFNDMELLKQVRIIGE